MAVIPLVSPSRSFEVGGRDLVRAEENAELKALEADRIAPVAAFEREKHLKLDAEIEKLKRLLGHERLL